MESLMLTIATWVLASTMSYNVDIGSAFDESARDIPAPAPPVAAELSSEDEGHTRFLGPPIREGK